MVRTMSTWKDYITEAEAESLAQWEEDARDYKDQAARCAVWKRRLADTARARMRKAKACAS
jgi:hypothetical protein